MTSDMPVTRNKDIFQVKEERTIFEDADTTEDASSILPLVSSIMPIQSEDESFQCTSSSYLSHYEDDAASLNSHHPVESATSSSSEWSSTTSGEYVSPEGITYLLWNTSSSEQRQKLYSSEGFIFSLDKNTTQMDFRLWRCSKKNFSFDCPAVVKELRGGGFVPNEHQHTHPSNQRCFTKVQISKALKRKIDKNPSIKIPNAVKKLIARYSPEDLLNQKLLEDLYLSGAKGRRKALKRKLDGISLNGKDSKKAKHSGGKKSDKKKKKKKRGKSEPQGSPQNSASVDSAEILPGPQAVAPDPEEYVLVYMPRKCAEKIFREGVSGLSTAIQNNAESRRPTTMGYSLPSSFKERQQETSRPDPDEMFFYSLLSEVKELPKLQRSSLKLDILSLVNDAIKNNAG